VITPVELHDGLWLKRDDLHAGAGGANGSKLRGIQALVARAAAQGSTSVISAASVLSPQNPNAAAAAYENHLPCHIILGGTKPETAIRHPGIRLAHELGADFTYIGVGYNPALQAAGRRMAEQDAGAYRLNYGGPDDPEDIMVYHSAGAEQVQNLPDAGTLIIPFGSGTTAATILFGMSLYGHPASLRRIVLAGIGPDRRDWLYGRLSALQVDSASHPPLLYEPLYPSFARYGDKMPEVWGGVMMHPTYEGKIIRYAREYRSDWLADSCLWVVGAPLR
jgi:Pyridoxal-phosphate dependent enzyme